MLAKMWRKGTLVHCWWKYKLLQNSMAISYWKNVWRFLKKLKTELQCDPAVPLLSIYLKELKSAS